MEQIKINCKVSDFLELDDLQEFQGELKKRTDDDVEKIKKSILKYGFSFPFFVWKNGEVNYTLDGHGRLLTLKRMRKHGYDIPSLPVVFVGAENEEEAKNLLLRLNSQYGKMTKDSILDFIGDYTIDFEDLALPNGVISFGDLDGEEYEMKINTPVYEITGECPEVSELVYETKFDELDERIDKANIPDDIKRFLKIAATRHFQFDYGKVAEFYAHADKEVQELMEESALVIIDFDKAIENGYVKMNKTLQELVGDTDDD